MIAVEHDQAGTGTEDGRAGSGERPQRLTEALALYAKRHRGRLAARYHKSVQAIEIGRDAHLAHRGAEAPQDPPVRLEIALQGEHTDQR